MPGSPAETPAEPQRSAVAAGASPAGPLSLAGIRVVDLSRVLAGPFCGALLGDLGADVLKVEDTEGGDESRTWPPHKDGESAGYLVNNRNKRGLAVNLKEPDGVEIVRRLALQADVLIENFRTGAMEEFGLGYEALAERNPRLVYCSVSAFGRTGPLRDEAGYEALLQAFSGIMSITGEPGGPPLRCGVSFLDLSTGILCAFGVVSALLHRERTGRGQRVDASLLETAVSLLNYHTEGYLLTGAVPRALGAAHPALSPYRTFRCRDGQWVFVAAANDRFFRRLATALGLPALAVDERYRTNIARVAHRTELEATLEEAIGTLDREGVLERLATAGVPVVPVHSVDEVLRHPQTRAREMVGEVTHTRLGAIPVVATPLKFSAMRPGPRRAAPLQGEHTDLVLAELGYPPPRVQDLRRRGVVR